MQRRSFIKKVGAAGLVTWVSGPGITPGFTAPQQSALEALFCHPPSSALPQAYWFWMNGHISKEGITLDLEAMNKAGIGGVFQFDAGVGIPKGSVDYLSPEWIALKQHAVQETSRLGLEFTMHNCPGWSSSGGPWITPELSMQQLTWSELFVDGGKPVSRLLPRPFHKLGRYEEVAVLAYPSLPGEDAFQAYTVDSPAGAIQRACVTGEDPAGALVFPGANGGDAWLRFALAQPAELRFLTFLISSPEGSIQRGNAGRTAVLLEASNDGVNFTQVASISTGLEAELAAGDKFITYDVSPVKAAYFRLRSKAPRRYSQVRFSGLHRLPHFLEKNGSRFMFSGEETSPLYGAMPADRPAVEVVNEQSVLNISRYVQANGRLEWNAPPGRWTVLRFGFTPAGTVNKAAPENGVGLECDKFSKAAIDFHFRAMLEKVGWLRNQLPGSGKLGLEIDSYEAGPQTWTKGFEQAFQLHRGYDLLRYLPALTGRIVQSPEQTERVLWDLRRVQADLVAENYYGRFTALCHGHGFTSYVEPYDKGPFEEMQVGSKADVCLGESWFGLQSLLPGNLAVQRTPKLAASIQHINGGTITGAEAFTAEPASSRWQEYPFSLKALGDKLFCEGVNKLVIHRFAHQPHPTARPGMTMGPWGIHFDRTNTWFGEARPWLQYLARCQTLLQQGQPVKDLLYFTGEEANVYTRVERSDLVPPPPQGYDYDLVNAAVLLNRVKIDNGTILLPGGGRYRLLVLQDFYGLTPPLLQRLVELVAAGMVLVGKKPTHSLGLYSPPIEAAFAANADALWGKGDVEESRRRTYGLGIVAWEPSLDGLLQTLDIPPDFHFSSCSNDAPLLYTHRRTGDADIYFVSNQRRTYEDVVCSFRVKNKAPEVWDAASGQVSPLPIYRATNRNVTLPLRLQPYGSQVIVFRRPVKAPLLVSVKKDAQPVLDTAHFPARSRPLFPSVTSNFTLAFWAKPEMNIMTAASVHMGNVKHPFTDHYAVFPSPGGTLYGQGHATCGLAVGRNGVAVWESEVYPVLVLVAEVPLSGWSHIALVYEKGVPAVYVNGKLAGRGTKSVATVHPGLGNVYKAEGASYYNGDMTEPRLYEGVMNEKDIAPLVTEKMPDPPVAAVAETVIRDQKPLLRCWQNGHYEVVKTGGHSLSFVVDNIPSPRELAEWSVRFPTGTGAPPHLFLPALQSLHRLDDPGVKYFSGTAHYTTQFVMEEKTNDQRQFFVDLGRVEVVANVRLNGVDCGLLWTRPYRADITKAIRQGENILEVSVTNLWPNRLIGDEQEAAANRYSMAGSSGFEQLVGAASEKEVGLPIEQVPAWYVMGEPKPADGRIAFTTWKHFWKDDPLLESGLIGPVRLLTAVLHPIG